MHSMIQFMKFFLLVSPTLQSRFRNQTRNKDRTIFLTSSNCLLNLALQTVTKAPQEHLLNLLNVALVIITIITIIAKIITIIITIISITITITIPSL